MYARKLYLVVVAFFLVNVELSDVICSLFFLGGCLPARYENDLFFFTTTSQNSLLSSEFGFLLIVSYKLLELFARLLSLQYTTAVLSK